MQIGNSETDREQTTNTEKRFFFSTVKINTKDDDVKQTLSFAFKQNKLHCFVSQIITLLGSLSLWTNPRNINQIVAPLQVILRIV